MWPRIRPPNTETPSQRNCPTSVYHSTSGQGNLWLTPEGGRHAKCPPSSQKIWQRSQRWSRGRRRRTLDLASKELQYADADRVWQFSSALPLLKETNKPRTATSGLGLSPPTQPSGPAVDWHLMPVEIGGAATAESNGTRSAYRHCRIPRHLTEEELLCATPLLLFPASISPALSVSELRKCSSCATPKEKSKIPRLLDQFRLLTTVYYSPQTSNLHFA